MARFGSRCLVALRVRAKRWLVTVDDALMRSPCRADEVATVLCEPAGAPADWIPTLDRSAVRLNDDGRQVHNRVEKVGVRRGGEGGAVVSPGEHPSHE